MALFKPGDWVLPNIAKLTDIQYIGWAVNQFGPKRNIPLQLIPSKAGIVCSKQKGWLLYCNINDDITISNYLVHVKLVRHKLLEEIKNAT